MANFTALFWSESPLKIGKMGKIALLFAGQNVLSFVNIGHIRCKI
jgi:hypothetical protein